MDLGPTELSATARGPHLELGKDKLSVRYTGDGRHDVGAIQANRPVPSKQLLYYFEVTVADQGELGKIGVGFTPKDVKLTRQPGWEPGSYGYHGDDGMRYAASGKGEEYGPRFGAGDTIGAAVHLGRNEIFFTKNGNKLKTAFTNVRNAAGLIPTVGLHSRNEGVSINFGARPFRFDLEGMLAEEAAAEAAAIRSVPVSPGVAHDLVHAYLLHYGFADTLAAFDKAAGLAGVEAPMSIGEEDPASASLAVRCQARRLIMAGDMQAAIALLQGSYPRVLKGGAASEEVQFHLSCQQYIELVRQRRINEAVQFAQAVLASLLHGAPHWKATLRDVVALIAYESPEASPLAHLMAHARRRRRRGRGDAGGGRGRGRGRGSGGGGGGGLRGAGAAAGQELARAAPGAAGGGAAGSARRKRRPRRGLGPPAPPWPRDGAGQRRGRGRGGRGGGGGGAAAAAAAAAGRRVNAAGGPAPPGGPVVWWPRRSDQLTAVPKGPVPPRRARARQAFCTL